MAKQNKTPTAPINSALKNKVADTAPRADIVLLVSCINSNYNGDPDDEGRPRIDDDNFGIMTAVSFKRKLRDTIGIYRDDESIDLFKPETNQIFVEKHTVRTAKMKDNIDYKKFADLDKALTAKDSSKDKVSGALVSREARAYAADEICKKFVDARMFGQVLGNVGNITGAVQVENSRSVNQVVISDRCITVEQVANGAEAESKQATMGRQSSAKYALFPIYIHVNPFRAKETGFTKEDYNNLLVILQEAYDVTNSSVRFLQFEKMYVFEHADKRGSMPTALVRKAVRIKQKVESPASFDDFDVELDKNLIGKYNGIKVIEK